MKQYRVIDIHDKYYNKWFISKSPRKVWRKNSTYKLKVRMQDVSVVQEYEDTDLHNSNRKKGHVSRILTYEEVNDVIGKLERG